MTQPKTTLYRCEHIRACEQLAVQTLNLSESDLMERAGQEALKYLKKIFPEAKRLAVFCGGGNNAGDGYVLARLAHQNGYRVKIYQTQALDDLPPTAAQAAAMALSETMECFWIDEALDNEVDVIVDALLGIGLRGEVRGELIGAVNQMNDSGLPIFSLDLPSGLNGDTGQVYNCCVKATHTLTFIARKVGMYTMDGPDHCGTIHCSDLQLKHLIGKIASFAQFNDEQLPLPLPERKKNSHKNDFGKVLILGGGAGMPGATALAAKAAFRTGAGSVTIATLPEHASALLPLCPEAMVYGIHSATDLTSLLDKASVCILGPGLGEDEWGQMVFKSAMTCQLPMVIDASALRLLAAHPQHDDNWVLTPHPGEAAGLLSCSTQTVQADRFKAIDAIQQTYGGVIVLKGYGSIIRTLESNTYINQTGNPGMATAGMGDVLSGIIAGLLAQGLSLSESARAGVWLHATAADRMASQTGQRGLMASDVFDALPKLVNGMLS